MNALVAENPAFLRTSTGFGQTARETLRALRSKATPTAQRAAAEIEQKQRLMLQKDASPKEDEPAAKEETPEQETAPAKDEEPAPAAQASGAAETPAQTMSSPSSA